ncbi:MAG: GNAT family N-acetyltransferase [Rhizobiaceae bacterium]|nr:GNAT family N-acetyltransferase [Rhizobiaceae bacterium]
MSFADISLRPITAIDVPKCQLLSAELKWPHRLEDWAQMYRLADGAVLETAAGEIIGSVFTALQGPRATIGLMIVKPAYQGKGLGRRLMEWAIQQVGDRPIALNATDAGVALYEKLGFKTVGVVHQYQGHLNVEAPQDRPHQIRQAATADFDRLATLSDAATGFDRRALLTDIFSFSRRISVLDQGGEIEAFGCLRPFGRGLHLGPLVASNADQATQVFRHLVRDLGGEFIRVDCPSDSGLEPVFVDSGLAQVSKVQQMVRGDPFFAGAVKQYGLATQALN